MTAKFKPDPACVICSGLGVRHTPAKRVGMHVRRDPCPCTILGPLQVRTDPMEAAQDLTATGRCVLRVGDTLVDHHDDGAVASYHMTRHLSEIPPIGDSHLNRYEAARERVHTAHLCRTPIDPPTTITGVIYKGNTDLPPSVRGTLSEYRDCTVCAGRGASMGVVCRGCEGYGKVRR